MQWLPETIEAITKFIHEAGVIGAVAFLFTLTVSVLLYKHLGAVMPLLQDYVRSVSVAGQNTARLLNNIAESNAAIAATSEDIKKLTGEVKDRVGKLPSDKVECKAKSKEEIIEIFRNAGGMLLTIEEADFILRQREERGRQVAVAK